MKLKKNIKFQIIYKIIKNTVIMIKNKALVLIFLLKNILILAN